MDYDIMAIGVHPDDLEIGIFGTLASATASGKKVLLVDLTAGEMGTNGNVEIRRQEALNASEVIGADRICLNLPDRGISTSYEHLREVVTCIRKYRPKWILYPFYKDYHPDHENGSRLVKEAIHSSGLIKFEIEETQPWRPEKTAMYYINDIENPNFYVNTSEFIELKKNALLAHKSQFIRDESSKSTYLNNAFIEKVILRDAYHGSLCGTDFAEALCLNQPILLSELGGNMV